MNDQQLHDTLEVLLRADVGSVDRDGVAAVVGEARRLRSWLDAFEIRCTRRTRELAAQGRAEPAESLLGRCGHKSNKEAAAVGDREKLGESFPEFEVALNSGTVSSGHLDAIANATRRLHDEVRDEFCGHQSALLASARSRSVEAFSRDCVELARFLTRKHDANAETTELERQRAASSIKRWIDKHNGMHHTHVELDAERDAKLNAALAACLRRLRANEPNSGRPFNQLEVDAFVSALTSGTTGTDAASQVGDIATPDSGSRSRELRMPEIGVLISFEWLIGKATEHGICETYNGVPIPVSTVRRLCCDAEIIPYVLNGDGEVTDLGRSSRTVNRAQRRRLRAMHRTCGHPDCQVDFESCRIHHVRFWTDQRGPTDVANLLPLCDRHHHLVHEGGWMLTMTPDRVATWARPDGVVDHVGSTIDRVPPRSGAPPGP